MSYYEWAKANPEKTFGYVQLVEKITACKEDIAEWEAVIEKAKHGVLTKDENPYTSLLGGWRSPFDSSHYVDKLYQSAIDMYGKDELEADEQENELAEKIKDYEKALKEKRERRRELNSAIRVARSSIEHTTYNLKRLEAELSEYVPDLHDWRQDIDDSSLLEKSLDDRLQALGFDYWENSLGGLEDIANEYQLQVRANYHDGWTVWLSDESETFEHSSMFFEDAAVVAALTYIDTRWDVLIVAKVAS